jgi:hypothetical protein
MTDSDNAGNIDIMKNWKCKGNINILTPLEYR